MKTSHKHEVAARPSQEYRIINVLLFKNQLMWKIGQYDDEKKWLKYEQAITDVATFMIVTVCLTAITQCIFSEKFIPIDWQQTCDASRREYFIICIVVTNGM